jgi:hypothetical protein
VIARGPFGRGIDFFTLIGISDGIEEAGYTQTGPEF